MTKKIRITSNKFKGFNVKDLNHEKSKNYPKKKKIR